MILTALELAVRATWWTASTTVGLVTQAVWPTESLEDQVKRLSQQVEQLQQKLDQQQMQEAIELEPTHKEP